MNKNQCEKKSKNGDCVVRFNKDYTYEDDCLIEIYIDEVLYLTWGPDEEDTATEAVFRDMFEKILNAGLQNKKLTTIYTSSRD